MTRGRWFRYAPLLGALFVVLVAAGFIVAGDAPDVDSSAQEIRDSYGDEAKHIIGAFLVALGAGALLFFASQLRAALRIVEPFGRMANTAFAGAIVAATGFLVAAGIHAGLGDVAQDDAISGQAVQALNVLDNWSWLPFSMGTVVMVLASGIAIVRGAGRLPVWLGWIGIVIGILFVTPVGFIAFIAAGLWVLVLSILLYARWDELHRGDVGTQPTLPGASIT